MFIIPQSEEVGNLEATHLYSPYSVASTPTDMVYYKYAAQSTNRD